MAKTTKGLKLLVWLFEVIANAEVPLEVTALIFDSKRMSSEVVAAGASAHAASSVYMRSVRRGET
eukprot:SAG31_NODE_2338_length_5921_cov_1.887324_5_plen_65_part_00